jgi:hypothetical protein
MALSIRFGVLSGYGASSNEIPGKVFLQRHFRGAVPWKPLTDCDYGPQMHLNL